MMSFNIIGIGEILWDIFPEYKQLGGAPPNFACHCSQLGANAYPVSCIGRDSLGKEITKQLSALKVDDSYIAVTNSYPTGTVQIELDDNGKPTYEICENVAWDVIPFSTQLKELAAKTDAVCFGSLAQRNEVSRNTIQRFLQAMAPDAVKIFDVNLRQSFYSQTVINESLRECNILKLSDEELPVLAAMFGMAGTIEEQLAALIEKYNLRLIAYTRGADGSIMMTPSETDAHPGLPGKAIDSVGAGDSFTAALCIQWLTKKPLKSINEFANRVATYVCSQAGATPVLPDWS
ncbi:MAG: carbohydrate kinase [Lentisphaeria bacterium]